MSYSRSYCKTSKKSQVGATTKQFCCNFVTHQPISSLSIGHDPIPGLHPSDDSKGPQPLGPMIVTSGV